MARSIAKSPCKYASGSRHIVFVCIFSSLVHLAHGETAGAERGYGQQSYGETTGKVGKVDEHCGTSFCGQSLPPTGAKVWAPIAAGAGLAIVAGVTAGVTVSQNANQQAHTAKQDDSEKQRQRVTGAIKFTVSGLQKTQVEAAAKDAIAVSLDVSPELVTVSASKAVPTARRLSTDSWAVGYEVTVPELKAKDVEQAAQLVSVDPAAFKKQLVTSLESVAATAGTVFDASSVTVTQFAAPKTVVSSEPNEATIALGKSEGVVIPEGLPEDAPKARVGVPSSPSFMPRVATVAPTAPPETGIVNSSLLLSGFCICGVCFLCGLLRLFLYRRAKPNTRNAHHGCPVEDCDSESECSDVGSEVRQEPFASSARSIPDVEDAPLLRSGLPKFWRWLDSSQLSQE